jgi:cytochrome c oxidase accessory protein FixG
MNIQTKRQDPEPSDRLYAEQVKIYPAAVSGTFRRIKWAILVAGLAIYYFTPFLRWTRAPGQPDQAILIDLSSQRFYFFFIEIWPQEVYYVTGLLIIAAFALFLMNALAGRLWCGYLCPQTVWTDLFFAVERVVQGDRRSQMRRDAGPWTFDKLWRKAATHAIWIVIAWWTGGAWVLYFADAPTLVYELATFQAPFIAYVWIAILTTTTYLLAGFAREQVCLYMCPWPRIQAALTDEWALNVSYRVDRGEPRGSKRANERLKADGKPAGDCVDCGQCVTACPTGVDIRNGLQMGCIQCGLCIDACDTVMAKLGREPRLIGYDTDINIARREKGEPPIYRFLRARTAIYTVLILAVGSVMVWQLSTRSTLGLNVLHDRNPIYVLNSDGSIRNGYTVRLINKKAEQRRFELAVEGLPKSARLDSPSAGANVIAADRIAFVVEPDQTREIRVLVTLPAAARPDASSDATFVLVGPTGERAAARDHFKAP